LFHYIPNRRFADGSIMGQTFPFETTRLRLYGLTLVFVSSDQLIACRLFGKGTNVITTESPRLAWRHSAKNGKNSIVSSLVLFI